MEQENKESNTREGRGSEEDATQVEEGEGASKQAAIVTNKTQAQEDKGQPKKGDGTEEQLLDPIKELKHMQERLWREMNYTKRKYRLLGCLPGFLRQRLSPKKVRNALHQLAEQSASEFLRALQTGNFKMFLNQLGVPEKRYRYGRDSHVSNVEHTVKIRIKCTDSNGFPGKPEHALGENLEKNETSDELQLTHT